jgi:hypothetical protein
MNTKEQMEQLKQEMKKLKQKRKEEEQQEKKEKQQLREKNKKYLKEQHNIGSTIKKIIFDYRKQNNKYKLENNLAEEIIQKIK